MVFETGLSDFHKMVTTVLKMHFPKHKPSKIVYRDYKNFRNEIFRAELDKELSKCDIYNIEYEQFSNTFSDILDKHAPKKSKYIRANQGAFMTKELRKAIMKRSRLRNKFLKEKSEESRQAYSTHRNYCVNLLRKTKKAFFSDMNVKKLSDN